MDLSSKSKSSTYSKNYGLIRNRKQISEQQNPQNSYELSQTKTHQYNRSYFRIHPTQKSRNSHHSETDKPIPITMKNRTPKYKQHRSRQVRGQYSPILKNTNFYQFTSPPKRKEKSEKKQIQRQSDFFNSKLDSDLNDIDQTNKYHESKLKVLYEQKKRQFHEIVKEYDHTQSTTNKDIINRQSPLNISKPEKFKIVSPLVQIPQEEHQQMKSMLKQQIPIQGHRNHHNHLNHRQLHYKIKSLPVSKIELKIGDKTQKIKSILNHDKSHRISVTIKVPTFFQETPDPFLSTEDIKFKSLLFFEEIEKSPNMYKPPQKISIFHHPQCFMASYSTGCNKKYGITWYNDSSIYCGEIENERREGLGMEWVPGVYIYYGNYHQNYRSGYGTMKYNNEEVFVGMWAKDHYHGFGKIFNKEGLVLQCGNYRNSQLKTKGDFRQLI